MQDYPKYHFEHFIEITNHFTGLKTVLFSYSPGFRDLYIGVQKESKYFLIKYTGVNYVQTLTGWTFNNLNISYVKGIYGGYKFSDRDYFEVICSTAFVIELSNHQEVIGIEPLLEKIPINSHLDSTAREKLREASLLDDIPLLARGTIYPFRYDRGKEVFFLEVATLLKRRFFLACYGCKFLKFFQAVPIERLQLVKEAENLLLIQERDEFLLKFTSIELHSDAEFCSYNVERFKEFSDRELFGIRNSILSIDEFRASHSTS